MLEPAGAGEGSRGPGRMMRTQRLKAHTAAHTFDDDGVGYFVFSGDDRLTALDSARFWFRLLAKVVSCSSRLQNWRKL